MMKGNQEYLINEGDKHDRFSKWLHLVHVHYEG